MATSNHRRLMVVCFGAGLMATLQVCVHAAPAPGSLIPAASRSLAFDSQQREAEGGGLVTVYYAVVPGTTIPESNMGPGPEMSVAWFSNLGERGRKEKRYGWKRNTQAEYELVLSYDGSGKTKWEMREHGRVGGRPYSVAFRSGHLWPCHAEPQPPATTRQVGFRDCRPGIPYQPTETAAAIPMMLAHFATYSADRDEKLPPQNAPGWIGCDAGCCSFGQ